eukprot:TRINITY_DN24050_c0_g1_i1.p1 TRINITY_DN24050_c0_g1~~TRINITY_DN24050_c0_g1_i1.p1  ORF type:complete len:441 (+),score=106.29 TRINITY_DN24050_c0_g1_i1:318-1640(+)
MQRVSINGPHDTGVWRRLVARADVIAHSFTAKQAALVLSAMARARHRDESFLRRFCVRFVPALVPTSELIDLCGMLSSLSLLGTYSEETYNLMAKRAAESAPLMDARQLSLVANAFSRVNHIDQHLFERLLAQVPRKLGQFEARDVAVLLNALASMSSGARASEAAVAEGDGTQVPDTTQNLEAIALRLPELLPAADLHSLTLILNAFAQLRFAQKDALDLLTEELLASPERLERLSPRQLAMVMNAAAKLHLFDPKLLDALSLRIQVRARDLDAQGLCVIANASAKLRLGIETFAALYTQVPRRLGQLSGRQLAMLCHAWAKAHVHNDDLFALLALPLKKCANTMLPHEIAISIYGYAHFRKAPEDLFNPLLERFAQLLKDEKVKEGDLLMVANALGRVGWKDDAVLTCLQAYVRRDPSMTNLSAQARATFGLMEAQED